MNKVKYRTGNKKAYVTWFHTCKIVEIIKKKWCRTAENYFYTTLVVQYPSRLIIIVEPIYIKESLRSNFKNKTTINIRLIRLGGTSLNGDARIGTVTGAKTI